MFRNRFNPDEYAVAKVTKLDGEWFTFEVLTNKYDYYRVGSSYNGHLPSHWKQDATCELTYILEGKAVELLYVK